MIRRTLFLGAVLLTAALDMRGQLSISTNLNLSQYGHFVSRRYASFRDSTGNTYVQLRVEHSLPPAGYSGVGVTPYSGTLITSFGGVPPNCYSADLWVLTLNLDPPLDLRATSNSICFYGPPPPPPGTDDQTHGPNEPLILDLLGDGVRTSDLGDPIMFDISGDGVPDRTAWTSRTSEDAFLYLDFNRNRIIDGASELFSDSMLMPDGRRAGDGREALSIYDDPAYGGNADGVISQADAVWHSLRLWIDRSHDGLMSPDENFTLPSAGIVDLSLQFEQLDRASGTDAAGNWHFLRGSFRQRVRGPNTSIVKRDLDDVSFQVDSGR